MELADATPIQALEFIPPGDRAGVLNGSSNVDASEYIQAALTAATPMNGHDAKVILARGRWNISRRLILPNKVSLVGAGRGDCGPAGAQGTAICALPSFPSGTSMVFLGDSANSSFNNKVVSMTIDGKGVADTGIENMYSQELSGVFDTLIVGCRRNGIWFHSSGSQNSSIVGVHVIGGKAATTETVGIRLESIAFHGLLDWTVDMNGYTGRPAACVVVRNGGVISSGHTEHCTNGIVLDGANGTFVSGVAGGPDAETLVRITHNPANQNIFLSALKKGAGETNIVVDEMSKRAVNSSDLGFYSLGNGTVGYRPVISSNGIYDFVSTGADGVLLSAKNGYTAAKLPAANRVGSLGYAKRPAGDGGNRTVIGVVGVGELTGDDGTGDKSIGGYFRGANQNRPSSQFGVVGETDTASGHAVSTWLNGVETAYITADGKGNLAPGGSVPIKRGGSLAFDFPAIASGGCEASSAIAVNGATLGDRPSGVGITTAFPPGIIVTASVSANGQMVVQLCNLSGRSYDPPATTFNVGILQ